MGKKDEPLPPGTTRANGVDGEILFDGHFVTIRHRWNAKSGRGESRYPIGAVTGVEVKPGIVTSIFTLVVAGGVQRGDGKSNRRGDPLSVEGGKQNLPGFQTMRDRILTAIAARDRAAAAPAPPVVPVPVQAPAAAAPAAQPGVDLAGQIGQLAALHAQGVLSDAEFASAKQRLIGGGPQDQPPRW